jgi:outer membrane protein assembly factor BamB
MLNRLVLISCVLLTATQWAAAGNWPHWRGDAGNGVALEGAPPVSWSDTKNVKWKVEIPGSGSGSPIVWENRVFVVTAVPVAAGSEELEFVVLCFDRGNGELIWKQVANRAKPHEGTHATNGFASASPCTDGEHLYAHFGSRGLYCYTLDGELVWKRDLGRMQARAGFGEGSSPTLAGDKVIVPWDHEGQSHLFALDKKTGETVWKVDRDEPTCWATPLIVEHNGKSQVIVSGQNYARSYELETGRELWRCAGQTQRPVASPVAANQRVFIGSGFRGSFLGAFRLDGSGDIAGSQAVEWTVSRDTPDIPSFLLSQGRLYYYKGKSGVLTCLNAQTGEPYYETQRVGLGTIYASPVAAGGHVYLTDRSGKTVVIEDGPELKVVATNSVGETVDATPAPVDNQLFIRGERHLFCIAE